MRKEPDLEAEFSFAEAESLEIRALRARWPVHTGNSAPLGAKGLILLGTHPAMGMDGVPALHAQSLPSWLRVQFSHWATAGISAWYNGKSPRLEVRGLWFKSWL